MTTPEMPAGFDNRLRAFAEVILRVGLNLQPGQRLLIAEPYELQGVDREAEVIVAAVNKAAGVNVDVIWGDGIQLRNLAARAEWREFARLVRANAKRMDDQLRGGDALLFLQGSNPRFLDGLPAERIARLRQIGWEHFGPVAQQLMQGATNWTVAPAPNSAWAEVAYPDLPAGQRLAALWEDVFAATRASDPAPLSSWKTHLQGLARRCADLNGQRLRLLRYQGEGTDLTVALPPEHLWCTAQLATKSGLPFVANLPTEEVFTVPDRNSAEGAVRVSRPVSCSGSVIDGIELAFSGGRVVSAHARKGDDLLQRLLDTDEGARRLGEVAVVADGNTLGRAGRLFHHPLLDENSQNHIALGEGYGFCLQRPNAAALNRSVVHVDLPFAARLLPIATEPS